MQPRHAGGPDESFRRLHEKGCSGETEVRRARAVVPGESERGKAV